MDEKIPPPHIIPPPPVTKHGIVVDQARKNKTHAVALLSLHKKRIVFKSLFDTLGSIVNLMKLFLRLLLIFLKETIKIEKIDISN